MLRIAIFGYGNLGRGAAAAAMAATDMELCGIFTRRDPAALGGVPDGVPVYAADSAAAHKGEIDALILCGGSADDLPRQTPQLARDFCVVDSLTRMRRFRCILPPWMPPPARAARSH